MCYPKTFTLSHCHPKVKTTSRWVISQLKLSVWNDPDVYHTLWVHWGFGSNAHFNKLTLGWWRLIHRESREIRWAWWVFGVCMNCGQSQTTAAQTHNAKQRNYCTAEVNVSLSVSEILHCCCLQKRQSVTKRVHSGCYEYSNLWATWDGALSDPPPTRHLFCAHQDHFKIVCIKLVIAFFSTIWWATYHSYSGCKYQTTGSIYSIYH